MVKGNRHPEQSVMRKSRVKEKETSRAPKSDTERGSKSCAERKCGKAAPPLDNVLSTSQVLSQASLLKEPEREGEREERKGRGRRGGKKG